MAKQPVPVGGISVFSEKFIEVIASHSLSVCTEIAVAPITLMVDTEEFLVVLSTAGAFRAII